MSAWVLQYAKTALESVQLRSHLKPSSSATSTPVPLSDEPIPATSSSDNMSSVAEECAPAPPLSKKAKLFNFMLSGSTSVQATPKRLTFADIQQQYALYSSDEEVSGRGLQVLNDKRFGALRPLGWQIFTAPASSAASESVFSRAGLIMHPTRSRLSKANLSTLVFLNCNNKL